MLSVRGLLKLDSLALINLLLYLNSGHVTHVFTQEVYYSNNPYYGIYVYLFRPCFSSSMYRVF